MTPSLHIRFFIFSLCASIILIHSTAFPASKPATTKEIVLTNPILKSIDGIPGFMDKEEIGQTLWLRQEIQALHNGIYRVNAAGQTDPSTGTVQKEFLFRGKKQNLKAVVELESQFATFSETEKKEFNALFATVKEYFDKVNIVLAVRAQGMHKFTFKLAQEFCQKANRHNSMLLNWKEGNEIELYRKSVTSFKLFYTFSTDLSNFMAALVRSCPKALESFKKNNPTAQKAS